MSKYILVGTFIILMANLQLVGQNKDDNHQLINMKKPSFINCLGHIIYENYEVGIETSAVWEISEKSGVGLKIINEGFEPKYTAFELGPTYRYLFFNEKFVPFIEGDLILQYITYHNINMFGQPVPGKEYLNFWGKRATLYLGFSYKNEHKHLGFEIKYGFGIRYENFTLYEVDNSFSTAEISYTTEQIEGFKRINGLRLGINYTF
jgi:hypothetical protein